jgi:hypothetical protein
METTFKIKGESMISDHIWISEGSFDPETANILCADMNSLELGKEQLVRYSTFIFEEAPLPPRKNAANPRYPQTPEAEKRLARFLDTLEKKG